MNNYIALVPTFILAVFLLSYLFRNYFVAKSNTAFLISFKSNNDIENFYYLDLVKGESYFSKNLIKILGINPDDKFQILETLFNKEKFLDLKNLLDRKINNVVEDIHLNGNHSGKKIIIEHDIKEKRKIAFECKCDNVLNSNYKRIGIILWFDDITEELGYTNKLISENLKLKQDISRLSNILNQAPFPIWERDENLNISFFNFSYSKIIAQEGEANFDENMLEMSKHSKNVAIKASKTKQTQTEEIHIVVKGQRRLYSLTEVPTENNSFIGFGFDISSKEKIKQELDRYICSQSDLLESSASGIAIFGKDTRIKFYNQVFVKMWSLDERWLSTKPSYGQFLELLREKRKLPEQVNFSEFKNNQNKFFTELISKFDDVYHLPNGKCFRILIIPYTPGGLLFVYDDMTDRLALERSYDSLRKTQNLTIDNLQEAIAVFAHNGRLALSNPCFANMWNLSNDFLKSEPHIVQIMKEIFNYFESETQRQEIESKILRALNDRSSTDIIIERKDESIIRVKPTALPDGALLLSMIDITDTMKVEQNLIERNRALYDIDKTKTEFLANISYELRSPLTSIIGFTEVLKQGYFGNLNNKQNEYICAIYDSSQYLMSLVNDVLDIASIDSGYVNLDLNMIDIYNTISSVLQIVKKLIKDKKIDLIFNCAHYFGVMLGDEKKLKQALLKIINNAIKFNKIGGVIIVSAHELNENKIEISVEDTGPGISKEEQKLVFEKFYRNNLNIAGKSGVGLGLSLVKSIIELHQGEVIINSDGVSGARISCVLYRQHPELLAKANSMIKNKNFNAIEIVES